VLKGLLGCYGCLGMLWLFGDAMVVWGCYGCLGMLWLFGDARDARVAGLLLLQPLLSLRDHSYSSF